MYKSLYLSAAIFLLLVTTILAEPTLYLNLRVAGTDSHVINSVTPGQVIPLEIYATMSEGATSPSFGSCVMGFKSTEGAIPLTGEYSNAIRNPLFPLGYSGNSHIAYDGIGGLDWGGVYPGTLPIHFFTPATTTTTTGVWNNDGGRNDVLLGTIDWTVSSSSKVEGSTLLTAFPLVNLPGYITQFKFWANDIQYSYPTTLSSTIIQTGEGVSIRVPEPSTYLLLILGSVGMWVYMRSKK